MSYIKNLMKQDERLLRRELRNARMSEGSIQEYLSTLPDLSSQSRWMRPDGTLCQEDEVQTLLSYHEKGGSKLSFSEKKN